MDGIEQKHESWGSKNFLVFWKIATGNALSAHIMFINEESQVKHFLQDDNFYINIYLEFWNWIMKYYIELTIYKIF